MVQQVLCALLTMGGLNKGCMHKAPLQGFKEITKVNKFTHHRYAYIASIAYRLKPSHKQIQGVTLPIITKCITKMENGIFH